MSKQATLEYFRMYVEDLNEDRVLVRIEQPSVNGSKTKKLTKGDEIILTMPVYFQRGTRLD